MDINSFLYQKKDTLIKKIVVKTIITIGLFIWLYTIMPISQYPYLAIMLFLMIYSMISWVDIISSIFSNWLLGLVGAIVSIIILSQLYIFAEDKGGATEIIICIVIFIWGIGIFFIDIIRLLIAFARIRKMKQKENNVYAITSSMNQNLVEPIDDNEIVLTGDISIDTNFLLQLKNDGIISEERFQSELLKITSK